MVNIRLWFYIFIVDNTFTEKDQTCSLLSYKNDRAMVNILLKLYTSILNNTLTEKEQHVACKTIKMAGRWSTFGWNCIHSFLIIHSPREIKHVTCGWIFIDVTVTRNVCLEMIRSCALSVIFCSFSQIFKICSLITSRLSLSLPELFCCCCCWCYL